MNQSNSLQGKTLLVVHTGFEHKKFIFPKLKRLGLTIIVLHKEKTSISPYVDHWIFADLNNHKECIAAIKGFLKEHPNIKIDGVITYWEESTLLVSRVADTFNLIGIPYNVTIKIRNKYNFREFCIHNGIKAPKHIIINKESDIETAKETLNFPVVIKPVFGSSSAFVIKVNTNNEINDVYTYIKSNVSSHPDSAEWDDLSIMIEEYIDGDEVDIDMLLQNGKVKFWSISDNYQTSEPFFVETGQAIPSSLPESSQRELVEMAEETLEKLGVQNGCIHFEAKSTNKGPVPIEVNLRMGGDEVYTFVKNAWGVDLVENAARIALGVYLKIHKPKDPKKYLTGKYFLSDNSGILSQLDIDEKLRTNKYLSEVHMDKEIGDVVLAPPEGFEFIGWITVFGDNAIDAEDNLTQLTKHIHYSIAKFDSESTIGKTSRKNRFSTASLKKDILIRAAKLENIKRINVSTLRKLKIGISCNGCDIVNNGGISDGVYLKKLLEEIGYKVKLYNFDNLSNVFNELKNSNTDLMINLTQKINNSVDQQPNAAALLEMLQIPYTGSDPYTLALTMDKIRTKKLMAYHQIPTPNWDYIYDREDDIRNDLQFPLIVKPNNSNLWDNVTQDSIVNNDIELNHKLDYIVNKMGKPALIEEYIEGEEYDVSILGTEEEDLEVLPLVQSSFANMPKSAWHIYSNDTDLNKNINVFQPAKKLSKKLESLITEISLDTYLSIGCRDYGRVEIRVDCDNNPYVIDINPDFPFETLKDLAASNTKNKKNNSQYFSKLIEQIIDLTINRYKKVPYITSFK